jgi:hypothetical protein
LEPWCDRICVDIDPINYINTEQKNTSFNLSNRILYSQDKKFAFNDCDIIIEFSYAGFTFKDMKFIYKLQQVIRTSGEIGKMTYDRFTFTINKIEDKSLSMINCL